MAKAPTKRDDLHVRHINVTAKDIALLKGYRKYSNQILFEATEASPSGEVGGALVRVSFKVKPSDLLDGWEKRIIFASKLQDDPQIKIPELQFSFVGWSVRH
mgnify:CR=1 FL=1